MNLPAKRYKVMAVEPGKIVLFDSVDRAIVTCIGVDFEILPLPGTRRRRGAPGPSEPKQATFPVEPEIATVFGDDFAPASGHEDEQL